MALNGMRLFAIPLILLLGCGENGDVDPTPTPEAPGNNSAVGGFAIGHLTFFDVEDIAPIPIDLSYSLVGAAFLNPDGSTDGGGAEGGGVPAIPIILGDEGFASDSCTYLEYTSEDEAREGEESSPFLNVGPNIDITLGDGTLEVPLLAEDALPPLPDDTALPPIYLLAEEGLDGDLYDPDDTYGLTIEGVEGFEGFSATAVVEVPEPLAWLSPAMDGGGEHSGEAPLALSWEGSTATYVLVDVRAESGEGLICWLTDDGDFEIPATQMAKLPAGSLSLTAIRTLTGYSEVRPNEYIVAAGVSGLVGHIDWTP